MFSFISINWRGRPLRTYDTIINLIGNTTNRGGMGVRARLDRRRYPTGRKVSVKEFRALKIERDEFHGDWNYVIKPRKEMSLELRVPGEDLGPAVEQQAIGSR